MTHIHGREESILTMEIRTRTPRNAEKRITDLNFGGAECILLNRNKKVADANLTQGKVLPKTKHEEIETMKSSVINHNHSGGSQNELFRVTAPFHFCQFPGNECIRQAMIIYMKGVTTSIVQIRDGTRRGNWLIFNLSCQWQFTHAVLVWTTVHPTIVQRTARPSVTGTPRPAIGRHAQTRPDIYGNACFLR